MDDKLLDKAIVEVFEEMTPEERLDLKEFIKIFNADCLNIDNYVRKMPEEEKNMFKKWAAIKNSAKTKNFKLKLALGITVEHNSFVEVITSDMCRTPQSVPRKGYTSVSRIGKG